MPKACNLEDVEKVKQWVNIPVICGGRFDDPELAEKDPDAYLWLIKTKASSAMLQYKKLAKDDWNIRLAEAGSDAGDISYKAAEIRDYFKNQYLYAESAYKLVATKDEIFDIDDSWLYGYDI